MSLMRNRRKCDGLGEELESCFEYGGSDRAENYLYLVGTLCRRFKTTLWFALVEPNRGSRQRVVGHSAWQFSNCQLPDVPTRLDILTLERHLISNNYAELLKQTRTKIRTVNMGSFSTLLATKQDRNGPTLGRAAMNASVRCASLVWPKLGPSCDMIRSRVSTAEFGDGNPSPS